MAIDTHIQNVAASYGIRPPDWSHVGSDFVGGLAGAYLAKKQAQREADLASGEVATPEEPDRAERFFQAFTDASGQEAMGANPLLREQTRRLKRENTLDEALAQNPISLMNEAGRLTPTQIPDWLQKHAAIRVSELGNRVWTAVNDAYLKSTQGIVQTGRARHLGELSEKYPNIDLTTPEGLSQAQRNESVKELYLRAHSQFKMLNQLPDEWFNPDGTINEQQAVPGIGNLPISEALRSKEEIAALRNEIAATRAAGVDPEIERIIQSYEKRTGHQFPTEKLQDIYDYKLGVKARPGVVREQTFSDYFGKHIDKLMEQPVIQDEKTKNYRLPRSREEGKAYLQKEYDTIHGPEPGTKPPEAEDMTIMKAPDGRRWKVPKSKVDLFKKQFNYTEYEG